MSAKRVWIGDVEAYCVTMGTGAVQEVYALLAPGARCSYLRGFVSVCTACRAEASWYRR